MFGALPAAGIAGGCASAPATSQELAPYPMHKPQRETLDVQVFRDGPSITLTNTTARNFESFVLWINAGYSREVESFTIGETLHLKLSSFRDQFGNAFRGGGFFSTEKPAKLVQAQIEQDDHMIGLIVIGGEGE